MLMMNKQNLLNAVMGFMGLVLFCGQTQAEVAKDWNLMLVGGSMNTCSSMAPSRCNSTDWIQNDRMRVTNVVEFESAQIAELLADKIWEGAPETQQQVKRAIAAISQNFADKSVEMNAFRRHFASVYPNLWRTLSGHQWQAIVDYLQQPLTPGVVEKSYLAGSSEPAGAQLFQTFAQRVHALAEAQEKPPLVLVVTASGRDSFDAIDFYIDSFQQLGVEAQWLPIDAAFAYAVSTQQCANIAEYRAELQGSFGRERIYPKWAEKQANFCENPDKVVDLVSRAQGVFINGGDQSLTRQAFVTADNQPFAWLQAIRSRLNEGLMVAGGTSAGTAVMSALPMISNGTSEQALIEGAVAMELPPPAQCEQSNSCAPALTANSLTYHPLGGLGLFPFGLLDTHFSERGRQARLLQLMIDTAAPLAVGVDETTALLVNTGSGDFRVQGAHGVFFLSHPSAEANGITSRFTYLRHGSGGVLSGTSAAFSAVHFSSQAQPDTGDNGRGEFLRDRTLTAALASCSDAAELYQGREGDVRVLLAWDEVSHLAHRQHGCEVALGVLHFKRD